MSLMHEIKEIILNGLMTDGAHHKQWYLEQLYKTIIGNDLEDVKKDLNDQGYDWENGIAP